MQVLLGGAGGYRSNAASNASNAVTDPFLSSLVLNFPSSEVDEISKSVGSTVQDTSNKNVESVPSWKHRY